MGHFVAEMDSGSNETLMARFFSNSRGNDQLIDPNNHVYILNKRKPNGKSYWKCEKYKTCSATASLSIENQFENIGDHNHGSDIIGLEAKLRALEAVQKARQNPNMPPRQILGDLANQSGGSGLKLALRTEGGLTKAIQRARAKDRDEPAVPQTFSDLFSAPFPKKYSKTSDGSEFLLVKDFITENSDKAFCIFMSPFGKQLLQTSNLWLADGTFLTAPSPFIQVYMICGQSIANRILPAAYCLLPNKETRTYDRMWETLKFALCEEGKVAPDILKLDYEMASANAFRNAFPTSRVSGCLFHLKRNLWDTVGKKHAICLYNTNPDFQLIVDLMAALAYVRHDKVIFYYDQVVEPLITKLPDTTPEVAFDYIDYYERTYVGRRAGRVGSRRSPMFCPSLWSIYEDIIQDKPTTNNALESFNAQWNATKLPSDNFWTVIAGFRREDSLAHERYLKDLSEVQNPEVSPDEGRKRKIAWRQKMHRLQNLAGKLDDIPPQDYLMAVNSLIKRN